MCGIVGTVGVDNGVPYLVQGLKRLEYRGYDSAGVAVVDLHGDLRQVRRLGKVAELEAATHDCALYGTLGIGHTRWATHGAPSERNAHPHVVDGVAVVHNGIIENHETLRQQLSEQGAMFTSETDTEVIPQLIAALLRQGKGGEEAFQAAVETLEGAYAIVAILPGENRLFIARKGSPLMIGLGREEAWIASDALPIVPYSRDVIYLENGDWGWVSGGAVALFNGGQAVERQAVHSRLDDAAADKGPYRHYMLKEIFEQGEVAARLLEERLRPGNRISDHGMALPSQVKAILFLACGTSYHAGMVATYLVGEWLGIPATCEVASEFLYRPGVIADGTLVVPISQSGETADTLAAVRRAPTMGSNIHVVAVCNVPESSLTRLAEGVIYTDAGPEIGVASTKAFTTQILALATLLLAIKQRTTDLDPALIEDLQTLPRKLGQALEQAEIIAAHARDYRDCTSALFLGRGRYFPIALEGALKLKEISYIHAEGYAAGEMKHGPIALIDEKMPVVVLLPDGPLLEKALSNVEEVKARGGRVIAVSDVPERVPQNLVEWTISVPRGGVVGSPILHVIPLQLLAYYVAIEKGTDVDQPRNLAKSVTVE
ncbi:MAG: glutamine--fructose-6-phosphate transaminase (isomerizing) [Alphaproteobacteria bacterium CG_4_10_14_0_2_um_filter_63_37]|nr:MAG: hypothetical protein AUJ55_11195 [Proteobacteria bacterium CG1_02_64_396]PJA25902.1 MAG: glutamine--fructose-6-phosphate transaminase (isomerizing) [Alphaproteobacteria bacterium CG_4_10_14_0_2_um_filter_63_37]